MARSGRVGRQAGRGPTSGTLHSQAEGGHGQPKESMQQSRGSVMEGRVPVRRRIDQRAVPAHHRTSEEGTGRGGGLRSQCHVSGTSRISRRAGRRRRRVCIDGRSATDDNGRRRRRRADATDSIRCPATRRADATAQRRPLPSPVVSPRVCSIPPPLSTAAADSRRSSENIGLADGRCAPGRFMWPICPG